MYSITDDVTLGYSNRFKVMDWKWNSYHTCSLTWFVF